MQTPGYRPNTSFTGSDLYSWKTKARMPHGANAMQPIGNSGQPGTAGTQKPMQVSQPYSGQAQPINNWSYTTPGMHAQNVQSFGNPGAHMHDQLNRISQQPTGPVIADGVARPSNQPIGSTVVPHGGQFTSTPAPHPAMDYDYYGMGQKANAVAAGAAQGFNQRGQAALNDAQQYYDSTRQLRNVGTPDYTDYNMKTAAANARNAESNARLNATNERIGQQIVDDQKYYDAYGPNGYYVAKDVKGINALAAAEQAKKDAFNAQYDANWDRYQAAKQKSNEELSKIPGVEDPTWTKNRLAQLTGEFANFQKAGTGLKFTDFIQAKINKGELGIDDSTVNVIAKNYGHQFNQRDDLFGNTSDPEMDRIDRAYQYGNDAKSAYRSRRTPEQEQGLQRRRAQAEDSAAIAAGVAKGMSPYDARNMVAQQRNAENYYNTMGQFQKNHLDTQLAMSQGNNQADIYMADALLASNQYDADMRYRDADSQRRFLAQQQQYLGERDDRNYDRDLAQKKEQAKIQVAQDIISKYPGQDYNNPATLAGMEYRDRIAALDGKAPIGISDAFAAGESKSPEQQMLVGQALANQIKSDSTIAHGTMPGLLVAYKRIQGDTRLTPADRVAAISSYVGQSVDSPETAKQIVNEITSTIADNAYANADNRKDSMSVTHGKAFLDSYKQQIKQYQPLLIFLAKSGGLSKDDMMQAIKIPDGTMARESIWSGFQKLVFPWMEN